MASEQALVLTDVSDGIATLTLNRPERRNALSPALIEALIETLAALRGDAEARVVVLTGAGDKAFCAGADLGSQRLVGGLLAMHEQRDRFVDVLEALMRVGKPTIARVQGACLGGGLGLLLACDMAVASETATFGTPEIRVGLFPMMIMSLIFRNMGRKRAMEMILTGEIMPAASAHAAGMVNQVVAPDALDGAVAELAGRVASFSPAVLKLGRDAAYRTMDMSLPDALQHLRSQLTLNTLLEDAAEGVSAFLGKREARWKGR